MAEIAVGIDLGTSNSCVAIARKRRVDVLPNAYGERTTASVVNIGADGSITVGNAAKANIIHDPTNTIYSAKRLIGRYFFSEEVKKARAICSYKIVEGENHSVRIQVREEAFSLPEIGAMVLRELKSIAESRLGGPVAKAVVTVPAYFNDNQRQATRDAARIAGLEVLRILNEPTAAALAYGFGKDLHQKVAVYDLGGGTFDISVLEIGEDVFEVLVDERRHLPRRRRLRRPADRLARRRLPRARGHQPAQRPLRAREAQGRRGERQEGPLDRGRRRDPDPRHHHGARWQARARSSARSPPRSSGRSRRTSSCARSRSATRRSRRRARRARSRRRDPGRRADAAAAASARRCAEYFQQEPRHDVDPDEVVAMGAAIHAASLVEQGTGDAYLLDVTPLSLQVGVAGGLSEPVIERNTPVPIEQTRTFTTARDDQESVGSASTRANRARRARTSCSDSSSSPNFQRGARGEVEIDVTFEINTDGIVNVTAQRQARPASARRRASRSRRASPSARSRTSSTAASRAACRPPLRAREAAAAPNRLQPTRARPPAARAPQPPVAAMPGAAAALDDDETR